MTCVHSFRRIWSKCSFFDSVAGRPSCSRSPVSIRQIRAAAICATAPVDKSRDVQWLASVSDAVMGDHPSELERLLLDEQPPEPGSPAQQEMSLSLARSRRMHICNYTMR